MLTTDLELPTDRRTLNAWARSFYTFDPDIHRIINQHAFLLTKYYSLKPSEDISAHNLIEQMLTDLHIKSLMEQMITEYFIIGEVFIYAELDEAAGKWKRLILQNPDYIVVRSNIMNDTQFYLRPDENLRRKVLSDKEEDIQACQKLSPSLVSHIKNGENIPLDNFHISHMMHKISPYEIRGTSFVCPLYRLLKKNERDQSDTQTIREALFDLHLLDSSIKKDVVYQRYIHIMHELEYLINQKLIAPIARINGFEHYPQVQFNKSQLRKELNKIK